MKRLFYACCITAFAIAPVFAADLRGAVAKIDITPSKPVMLSGYASRKELSDGVHDPLSARVTAFEQDGQRLVLVSAELIGFYGGTAEQIGAAIRQACGLERSELFLSATHTHSAPTLTLDVKTGHTNNLAYTKDLQEKLSAAVRGALDQWAPIELGAGIGASPVGSNRRERVKDGTGASKIVLGRNPAAAIDREVQVLELRRKSSSERAAILFGYATHSTALGPRNLSISGDVHGLASRFIENQFAGTITAAAFAGASGDIDPWYRVLPGFKTTNDWIPEPVLLGSLLGTEVVHVLSRISTFSSDGPVMTRFKTVELPAKPRGDAAEAGKTVTFNITVGRVGNIAFAGLGGEVFNEIGQAIKSASPFPLTFVITHCNGSAGYLPTRSSYDEGGYEIQTSPFAASAAEIVIKETVKLLGELKG